MRKIVLVALATMMLASAAFAQSTTSTTTYTETLYPSLYAGYAGENWISLKGVPLNPDPLDIFKADPDFMGLINDGRLVKLNPVSGGLEGYYDFQEPNGPFGNMLLGEGYKLYVQDANQHPISYVGIADGVPDAAGAKTDMWISLPGQTGQNGGWHWIGCPFATPVLWTNIKVTDGTVTIPVWSADSAADTAVTRGWLQMYWSYSDNAGQSMAQVDPDGIVGSDSLEPGKAYEILTFKSNIALIIPAP